MPSPFPGMDPYFERAAVWPGFYNDYLIDIQRALAPQVEPRYVVDVEDRLYIDVDEPKLFAVADLAVSESPGVADESEPPSAATTGVVSPVVSTIPRYRRVRTRRRWLTIRDKERRAVVTVIERHSPSDKRSGRDHERYLAKRDRVIDGRAALVEIDLLRGGIRSVPEAAPGCDHWVLVSRP